MATRRDGSEPQISSRAVFLCAAEPSDIAHFAIGLFELNLPGGSGASA